MSKREFVEMTIKDNKVVVFSKSWCPYCKKVVETLRSLGVSPLIIELDERQDGSDIEAAVQTMTGARTVLCVVLHL